MMVPRSQWVTLRPTLSNWITETESEAGNLASLSNQFGEFALSPLLAGGGGGILGLDVFGGLLADLSFVSQTELIEVPSTRNHWLESRGLHSNWRTDNQNEEYTGVSLSYQNKGLSSNPLLMNGPLEAVGLLCFGLALYKFSSFIGSHVEDLVDILATEELVPITDEDMEELVLA